VEKAGIDLYTVWTTEPARDNKANFAVTELVVDYFGVKKNQVFMVRGEKGKKKSWKL